MKRGETCTKDKPDKEAQIHPDSFEYRDQSDGYPGGDIAHYECRNCGLRFSIELPQ